MKAIEKAIELLEVFQRIGLEAGKGHWRLFVPRFEGSFSSDSCTLFQLPVALVFITVCPFNRLR